MGGIVCVAAGRITCVAVRPRWRNGRAGREDGAGSCRFHDFVQFFRANRLDFQQSLGDLDERLFALFEDFASTGSYLLDDVVDFFVDLAGRGVAVLPQAILATTREKRRTPPSR